MIYNSFSHSLTCNLSAVMTAHAITNHKYKFGLINYDEIFILISRSIL